MILKPNCEILVTYTKRESPIEYTQKISGHLFELFDYYWILKNAGLSVKIWIPENTNIDYIKNIINQHYSVNFDENDIIIGYQFDIINVHTVLNVDDCHYFLVKNRKKFLCKKFFSFACGDSYFEPQELKDIVILSDRNIYKIGEHYVKKVLPKLNRSKPRVKEFAHITKNCKSISNSVLAELLMKYPEIYIYSDYLNCPNAHKAPIFDFAFEKYIYTPVSRKFDCSPRLPVECWILGIPVVYMIDYFDPGLEIRVNNPANFVMGENDEILNFLK